MTALAHKQTTHGDSRDASLGTRQFLTFTLGDEAFGVDILRVQEIRGWTEPTRVPHAPAYLRGVVNLRGAVVPIVDLRTRFGLPAVPTTKTTVVIVLQVHGADRTRKLGIVVDAVSDVRDIETSAIKPPADVDTGGSDLVAGLVTDEERLLIVLDADRLAPATAPAIPTAA